MKTTLTVRIDRFYLPKPTETWTANGSTFQTIGGTGTDVATGEALYLFNNCKVESTDFRFSDLDTFTGRTAQLFVLDEAKRTGSGTHKVKILGYPGGKGDDSKGLIVVTDASAGDSVTTATGEPAAVASERGSVEQRTGTPAAIPPSGDFAELANTAIEAMRAAAIALQAAVKGSGGKHDKGAAPPPEHHSGEEGKPDGEAGEPSPSDPRSLLLAHFGGGSGVALAYKEHLGGGESKPVAQMNDDECLALARIVGLI